MVHDIMWMLVNDSDMVYPGNGVMRKSFMNLVKTNFFFPKCFLPMDSVALGRLHCV